MICRQERPAWPTGFAQEEWPSWPHEIAWSLEQYGYVPQGLPQLRQAIGLPATLLLQRGDTVILENPTFFGAIDTFALLATSVGIPIDASGLDIQRVSELLSARVAQCLYLIPTYHDPTGNTLTEMQRRQLVKMTQQVNIPLIEDLTMANNVLEGEPPPPLATYAQDGGVITIGSLSKLFGPVCVSAGFAEVCR